MSKIDWRRKLTSRKLWMAIASFASMLLIYFGHAESEVEQIAALIMAGATVIGYIVGEGLADSATYIEDNSTNFGKSEDDEA